MFELRKTIGGALPRIPFERIAGAILGSGYELSLVICGDALGRKINAHYRKKTHAPNVLSFPLEKTSGEIFLNARKAAREAKHFQTTCRNRLALLFVHACFHLKGLRHGRTMEGEERRILRRFGFDATAHIHRNRYWDLPRQGRHRLTR